MAESEAVQRREALLVPGVFEAAAARARSGPANPALESLVADAERALEIAPPSVLDKPHVPPSGDKRDYFSLSIYFWPDPEKPDGLPYVPRDGVVNPETEQYDRSAFVAMADHVDTLTFAYACTGEERFAEKAAIFLRTWFLDPRTGMRPNMLFAQYIPGDKVATPWKQYPARFVPGVEGRKGIYVSFGGVIEDVSLIPLTDCFRLLRRSRHWSDSDESGMRTWYAAYARWLRTHQHGLDEAACRNNHGSWYWAGIASFLEVSGAGDEVGRLLAEVLPQRLQMQVEPDGSQPEELGRAISQHYTAFALTSFTNIAIAAGRVGFDAWAVRTNDGRSIRRALDWMVPYLTGGPEWRWRQIKPFDPAVMVPALTAAAARFPQDGYRRVIGTMPPLPKGHRYRLLYDVD